MKRLSLAALALLPLLAAAPAQAQNCTPSKWGANDQIGALNNITPANVLEATKLVKRGKSIRMGIETNSRTPAYPPRTFSLTVLSPGQENGVSLGATKTNYNDDIIMGWVGIGSQLDGLGHIGSPRVRLPLVGPEEAEAARIEADIDIVGNIAGLSFENFRPDRNAAAGGALPKVAGTTR